MTTHDAFPEQRETGAELIARERARQISEEGWTSEHDTGHRVGELTAAARSYALQGILQLRGYEASHRPESSWPWDIRWWKPSEDPVRNLVKAGALIAAEIDRTLR